MNTKPFWENGYNDANVSTFSKGPTRDVKEFYDKLAPNSLVLDVGCGEGRNALFLSGLGHSVDAFDLSLSGVEKARNIAENNGLVVNFFVKDLCDFQFEKHYDVILSHGVLHLPEKKVRNDFILKAQEYTKAGGYNFIGIFTNRLPATSDNAPFTKSLFDVGELIDMYKDWEIIYHTEGTFIDTHPGGIHHEHAQEGIIALKIKRTGTGGSITSGVVKEL